MKRRAWSVMVLAAIVAVAGACGDDDDDGGGSGDTTTTAAPSTTAAGATLEGTSWALTGYAADGEIVAPAPSAGAAMMSLTDGKVAGSTGCNTFNGSYTLDGESLSFGPLAITNMACEDALMTQEAAVIAGLEATTSYGIEGTSLELLDDAGEAVLTFQVMPPTSLTEGTWGATGINNGKGAVESLAAGSTVTAIFGSDGQISGNAGCNQYTGTYTTDGDTIEISQLASTKMACADEAVNTQEQNYLAALPKATTWSIVAGKLELRDDSGALQVSYQLTS